MQIQTIKKCKRSFIKETEGYVLASLNKKYLLREPRTRWKFRFENLYVADKEENVFYKRNCRKHRSPNLPKRKRKSLKYRETRKRNEK